VFFNSVLGARTNRGGQLARLAALVGRTPELGYLRDESRAGTHRVSIALEREHLRHPADWSLLGSVIGKIVQSHVPVLEGLPRDLCTREHLLALGAALATSGSVTLFHIPGVTPEAPDLETAFRGRKLPGPIAVGARDLAAARAQLTPPSPREIDFVTLGCPHHDLAQIERVAAALDGQRVADGVRFWICTARATRAVARERGSAAVIERAGALLVADTCPVEAHMRRSTCREHGLPIPQCECMVTDSVKMATYVRDLIGCETILSDVPGCLESARTGRWEPRPWP
jgi:predicted aconitase